MNPMNHVTLIGRLSKDVDVRAAGETKVARTTVAVQRNYKGSDGNYGADFISVVAFGKTADFLENNFTKGKPIIVTGAIQTGSYTNKDGQKVYTTDIAADNVSFVPGSKSDSDSSEAPKKEAPKKSKPDADDDFMNIAPEETPELPW